MSLKILWRLLCSICLSCMIVGCSSSSEMDQWMQPNGKIKVLSTTAMIDNIVGQIGEGRIDHLALVIGEIDPHSYELVKGDDEKLSLAQVIFYNGLGLEHGASLRYKLMTHPRAIAVGAVVQKRYPDLILHTGHEIDPHIWMDISMWSHIIDPIVEQLTAVDPEGHDLFVKNAEALAQKMAEEHRAIQAAFQEIPQEKRYLVTSHDAFNYFTRAYLAAPDETTPSQWQKRCEAPEGLAPDGQLSISDIQAVIDHLIHYHITTVFPESNVSRDSLTKIVHACRQKGLEVVISSEILYGDAMGGEGSDADTYLLMIQHDANVLLQTWKNNG